jgi:hypothetical protein
VRGSALGPLGRTTAALLALVWVAAGIAAIVLGLGPHRRLGLLAGPFAIAYGVLWVRAAWTGRRLDWWRGRR